MHCLYIHCGYTLVYLHHLVNGHSDMTYFAVGAVLIKRIDLNHFDDNKDSTSKAGWK